MITKALAVQNPFKKVMLVCLVLLFSFSVVLLLGGCDNSSDEQRISELEAQVERLQEEQNADNDQASENATNQEQDATDEATYDDATVQDISVRADDLISRAEAADVPNDRDARIDAFFDLDSEFNALELEIDTYEDQKEAECRSGSISWEDYRALELQLEQIEDKLDNAQDKLEVRFGIDD